jgi:hypothetical protein
MLSKIAMLLASSVLQATSPASSAPGAGVQPQSQSQAPTSVEDVEVEGRRSIQTPREQTQDFVRETTTSSFGARPGRWRTTVCVRVSNFAPQASQYMIDRIADVTEALGLRSGEPGCTPNIYILATHDGQAQARNLVRRAPEAFRPRSIRTAPPRSAIARFESSEAPVRWWQNTQEMSVDSSMPVARALEGNVDNVTVVDVRLPSRFRSTTRFDLANVFIILDISKMEGVSLTALSDYVAMISLAQIDPEGDFGGTDSILNLFGSEPERKGMSQWDLDYLSAIYTIENDLPDSRRDSMALVNEIQRIRRVRDTQTPPAVQP